MRSGQQSKAVVVAEAGVQIELELLASMERTSQVRLLANEAFCRNGWVDEEA